jgi:hypothetical protein
MINYPTANNKIVATIFEVNNLKTKLDIRCVEHP